MGSAMRHYHYANFSNVKINTHKTYKNTATKTLQHLFTYLKYPLSVDLNIINHHRLGQRYFIALTTPRSRDICDY